MGKRNERNVWINGGRKAEKDYLESLHAAVDTIYEIAHRKHGWNWAQLARQAGLSYNTVSNLGSRNTQFPEFRTVYRLAKAVGVEVIGIDNNTKYGTH
jgi:lambda repressor-like predicted transcriptional regulator